LHLQCLGVDTQFTEVLHHPLHPRFGGRSCKPPHMSICPPIGLSVSSLRFHWRTWETPGFTKFKSWSPKVLISTWPATMDPHLMFLGLRLSLFNGQFRLIAKLPPYKIFLSLVFKSSASQKTVNEIFTV
jgi:hypothetical protein